MSPKEIEIHDPAMIRSMVYDLRIDDPEKILAKIGLPPVSAEGAKVEEEASQRRLARVTTALPLFARQAAVVANVLAREHARMAGEEDASDTALLPVLAAYQAVSLATIVTVLSYFLDAGIFRVASGREEFEDDDE